MCGPDLNTAALGLQSHGGIDHESLRATDSKVRMEEHHPHHPAHKTYILYVVHFKEGSTNNSRSRGSTLVLKWGEITVTYIDGINIIFLWVPCRMTVMSALMRLQILRESSKGLHRMEAEMTTDFWNITNWWRLASVRFLKMQLFRNLRGKGGRHWLARILSSAIWNAVMQLTIFFKLIANMNGILACYR